MDSENLRRKENERATTLQTLVGKRPAVMDVWEPTTPVAHGRKLKEVRFWASQGVEEGALG